MAHFQVLKPSQPVVTPEGSKTVSLDIRFTHPMEQGPVMEMGEPEQFGVLVDGEKKSLMDSLQERTIDGSTAYTAEYRVKEPGDHVFYIEPSPYWEPAEGKMIVHYTKVVVNALGLQQGWDSMVGFPVEIKPLTRPYGLWTGNVFRGVVMRNGEPVPGAEIEVEYYNEGSRVEAPSSTFVTQVLKTDENGVFSYAIPREGWWGFAALVEGPEKMKAPSGKKVPVEQGGLIWVRARDMK
ncbi:MAG: DUF4198 domain-containing protein [Planctomycetota bacterium]